MYEKLVKLARHCAEKDACINCSVGGCEGPTGLINQLANAIEELNKRFAYEIALEECWHRLENRPLPDIPEPPKEEK